MPGISFGVSIHRFHPDAVLVAIVAYAVACSQQPPEGSVGLEPTVEPPAAPTYTPRPTLGESSAVTDRPTTTSTAEPTETSTPMDKNFVAQRTRTAPTTAAAVALAPTLVNLEGRHFQWIIGTSAASAQQKARNGFVGTQSVNDEKGQQYSCAVYLDGTQIPRVNLAFSKGLAYQVVTNQFGEQQGVINAITTVASKEVPVEWRTWTTRVDRIRLRGTDAESLVQSIDELNAEEFVLELKDDPELSATYDVSNLIAALAANKMACF